MKAVKEKLIIRPIKNDRSAGGIHLPDNMEKQETLTAEVVSVGEGMRTLTGELIANSAEVGDRILVPAYALFPFHHEGHLHAVIVDSDVLAILPPFDPAATPPVPIVLAKDGDVPPLPDLRN